MNIMLSDPQPQLWISALCPWNPTNDPNRPLGYVWRNCGGGLHCRMESTKGRYFNLSFPVLKMLSHENAIFHARSRRSPKNNSRGPLWYRMRAAMEPKISQWCQNYFVNSFSVSGEDPRGKWGMARPGDVRARQPYPTSNNTRQGFLSHLVNRYSVHPSSLRDISYILIAEKEYENDDERTENKSYGRDQAI
ncbi:hypothetical protein BDZ45DRAFT_805875 [Acephala macrosclerotiorum]|nr:hypothetical protein BDZ45DRAFT_805875 [Acephala macrosclerotiorum]